MSLNHQVKDNVYGTVQNNPLSSGGTNLVTDSNLDTLLSGMSFPYWLTIWSANLNPNNDPNMEVVEVTARVSPNNYTIGRGQQGTVGASHAQGSNVGLLWTAGNAKESTALQDSVAQGDIYYIGSDLLPHLLAPGAAGTVLSSNGTSANPSYISIPSITFGDGSDGVVTISSPTTLTRDMYYQTLTVNSTLTTAGYRIFVKGTISGSGTIQWGTPNTGGTGGNGSGGGPAGSGGAGASVSGSGFFTSQAGGAGGSGNNSGGGTNGTNLTAALGTVGGTGGSTGEPGAVGGTITGPYWKFGTLATLSYMGLDLLANGTTTKLLGSSGGGGGGGGTNGTSFAAGGGGGGASGGDIFIAAATWAGTFTISSIGGTGGVGGTATNAGSGNGGGGGAGGNAYVFYGTKTWTGSYTLTGGTGGAAGTHSGTGSAGSNGGNGANGNSFEFITSSAFLR